MLYLNQSFPVTSADVIIIPCSMSGKISPDTPQWDVLEKYGAAYEMEFLSDIENQLMIVGTPGIFKPSTGNQTFLHVPVFHANEAAITLSELLESLKECAEFVAGAADMTTIAVPPLGGDFSWDIVEHACSRLETIYGPRGMEFWMYPDTLAPDDDRDMADDAEAVAPVLRMVDATC